MNIFIGIDPGKKGALAMNKDGIITVIPFDEQRYCEMLKLVSLCNANNKVFAVLEKVNAMPGQGVTSMFNFGANFGWIQGVLQAYGIPYELVTPQKWKKEFGLIHQDKKASIEICKKLIPNVNLKPTERCKVDNDGMAEALLMSVYAERKWLGELNGGSQNV